MRGIQISSIGERLLIIIAVIIIFTFFLVVIVVVWRFPGSIGSVIVIEGPQAHIATNRKH